VKLVFLDHPNTYNTHILLLDLMYGRSMPYRIKVPHSLLHSVVKCSDAAKMQLQRRR